MWRSRSPRLPRTTYSPNNRHAARRMPRMTATVAVMSLLVGLRIVLRWLINAYLLVLFARMIIDWVRVLAPMWRPGGAVYAIIDVIYRVTEPPLRWLRRYIHPLPMGAVQLDVSFIVLYFILIVLQMVI